jgi:iron complex transport system substrate-binding protein
MNSKRLTQITAAIAIISIVTAIGVHVYYQRQISELMSQVEVFKTEISHLSSELSRYKRLTLVDDHGFVLNLTSYPEKIVSLAPSNTEIIFAVGSGDKVVAVTDYCNYPYNFSAWIEEGNMSSVGGYWNPSIESIVSLDSDLIIASPGSAAAVDNLRSMGYNVLMLDPKSINDVLQDIILVGRATGKDVEAGMLVGTIRLRMDSVISKVSGSTYRPSVYCEIWYDPLMSAGPNTWIGELISSAGGQNIFENATSEWPIVSSEAIIQQNPNIIIFPHAHGDFQFWGSFDEVKARTGWDTISAVQNDQMYVINSDIVARGGPRLADALEILAEIIHPESFP